MQELFVMNKWKLNINQFIVFHPSLCIFNTFSCRNKFILIEQMNLASVDLSFDWKNCKHSLVG